MFHKLLSDSVKFILFVTYEPKNGIEKNKEEMFLHFNIE